MRIAILTVLLTTSLYASAQAPSFQKAYGGTDNDFALSVIQTFDGGYIAVGATKSFGSGWKDVYIIKTDPRGDTLWTKSYGGIKDDWAGEIIQTSDSGYLIVGYTKNYGPGTDAVYLIKINPDGDSTWTRSFGGLGPDFGNSVKETNDGGYIIGGITFSFGAGGFDYYLIRTDFKGDTLWTKTYGGIADELLQSIEPTKDGGFILFGVTWSYGAGEYDYYLVKTDSSGNQMWSKTYGYLYDEYGSSAKQTKDGGYIMTGFTESFPPFVGFDDNILVIKTDSAGNKKWEQLYNAYPGTSQADDIIQTSDGGYAICGKAKTIINGISSDNLYLIKTDSKGDTIWTKIFGGSERDRGYSLQQTNDGGFIIAGSTESYGQGKNDVYLIKTDSNGIISTEIDEIKTDELRLSIYPNPFHTHVTITLPSTYMISDDLSFVMFDLFGREIARIDNIKSTTFDFYRNNIPNGIYMFRIIENQTELAIGKLILD